VNQDQITSLVRALLAAGGPVAGILVASGMEPGMVNSILAVAVAVIPLAISIIWGQAQHTDHAKIAAASKVPGVSEVLIEKDANGGAGAAAGDGKLTNVNRV
jgi:ABC-type antimicrobial peptide transport system permease subunit